MDKSPDRATVFLGGKVSDGNYGSRDWGFHFSADRQEGEDLDQYIQRVIASCATGASQASEMAVTGLNSPPKAQTTGDLRLPPSST